MVPGNAHSRPHSASRRVRGFWMTPKYPESEYGQILGRIGVPCCRPISAMELKVVENPDAKNALRLAGKIQPLPYPVLKERMLCQRIMLHNFLHLPLSSNSTTDQRMQRVRTMSERTLISWSGYQAVSFRSLPSTTRSLTTLGSTPAPATWTARTSL